MLVAQGEQPFESFIAEQGDLFGIDPATHHSTLEVDVAQVRDGVFKVLHHFETSPNMPNFLQKMKNIPVHHALNPFLYGSSKTRNSGFGYHKTRASGIPICH